MSYALNDFHSQLLLVVGTFFKDPNEAAELNTIRIALGGDATTHDTTIKTAPMGLIPGHHANSPFVNQVTKLINRGKAGNLTTVQMANVIGSITSSPPTNLTPPTITYASGGAGAGTQPGAVYARGTGTWSAPTPTYTQQWMRSGTPIAGSTGTTYTTQAADAGTNLSCVVTATNPGGSTPHSSNSVAIT